MDLIPPFHTITKRLAIHASQHHATSLTLSTAKRRYHSNPHCRYWLVIVGMLVANTGLSAPGDASITVQFYIKSFGASDLKDQRVARAGAIFDQLRQIAEKPGKYKPRLQVIDSTGEPWAIALPDGYVVLSRRSLDIMYEGVTEAEGDARLAFVLGHELAHLVKNDFWHQEMYQALAGDSSSSAVGLRQFFAPNAATAAGSEDETRYNAIQLKEAEADERGFIYAGVAGFPVDTLLGQPATGKPDFFQHWVAQTQTRAGRQHPAPQDRAYLLRARLQRVRDKLELFHYGVRLAHFGRYDDAEYFLREFQQVFPAREVNGNLGYLYLQKARAALPAALAFHYCLPSVLESRTRAATLVFRGSTGLEGLNNLGPNSQASEAALSPQVSEWLNDAAQYLKQALEADADYLPARLNLAVIYFYLNELYEARATIEKALKSAPTDMEAQYLRALILYQENKSTDLWPDALKILEELAAKPAAPVCVTYNLAQILEERGREGKAKTVWAGLVQRLAELPAPHRQIICQKVGNSTPCGADITAQTAKELPWPLPVSPGLMLPSKQDDPKHPLAGWTHLRFDWHQPGMEGYIHTDHNGASVLELDGVVEMVVTRPVKPESVSTPAACCGTPTAKRTVTNGEIWSFGPHHAALIRDGQVQEWWAIR